MKTLIFYFSHNKENYFGGTIRSVEVGNTQIVAEKLQSMLDADIYQIKPLHEYPEKYDECTAIARKELDNNERPKIMNMVPYMEEYDTIYLGYPNWWGTMPMCLWTFLESYDLKGKKIYPFCTHEGSGLGNSINDLKKICSQSIIKKGLALKGSQVKQSDQKLKEWLKEE